MSGEDGGGKELWLGRTVAGLMLQAVPWVAASGNGTTDGSGGDHFPFLGSCGGCCLAACMYARFRGKGELWRAELGLK